MDLINPKEIEIALPDGGAAIYILSDFPAVQGREIVAKYPTSGLPKIGDYAVSEDTMLKLMSFVAVGRIDKPLRLSTRALIDNHVKSWETLAKIEMAMMEKNCSFFRNGRIFDFLEDVVQKLLAKISEISIPSSAPSSPAEKPLSTN